MENINIIINKKTRQVYLPKSVIGNDGENLQENLVFSFDDEFVNGTARLELKLPNETTSSYLMLTKVEETYQIPVKSVITKTGRLNLQLVITEGTDDEEIPIFKSNKFYLVCNSSLNALIEQPEEYPQWIDVANAKLNEIDEAISNAGNLDVDVSKEGTIATVTITHQDETQESVEILDGEKGDKGDDATINGVKTLNIKAGMNIIIEQENNDLTINATSGGVGSVNGKTGIVVLTTNDLENDSGYITKDVDDLTNYTKSSDLSNVATSGSYNDLSDKPDLSIYATSENLGTETTNRQNADLSLQNQIDAITSASDVVDVVSSYSDLENYDTTKLTDKDVIKVMQDSTHSNAISYYRWTIVSNVGSWVYVGSEGPFYTKGETDTLLNGKVSPTDYASTTKGGTIIIDGYYGTTINQGKLRGSTRTYEQYQSGDGLLIISKNTLENVITGKQLVNQTYVDNLVGDISSAIDLINGESV